MNLRPLRPEARSVSRRGRELGVNSVRGGVPECTGRRPGSESVGHSAASSPIPRKLRMKPCFAPTRTAVDQHGQGASEDVAVFDAVRNLQVNSFHAMVAWEAQGHGLRALVESGCAGAVVEALSPAHHRCPAHRIDPIRRHTAIMRWSLPHMATDRNSWLAGSGSAVAQAI